MRSLKPETIGYIVIALTAISVCVGAKTSYDVRQQQDKFEDFALCQAQYNDANSLISQTRANLATRDRKNGQERDAEVSRFIATGKGDLVKAFAKYNRKLAKIEADRAKNPLPEYPDCYDKYLGGAEPRTK